MLLRQITNKNYKTYTQVQHNVSTARNVLLCIPLLEVHYSFCVPLHTCFVGVLFAGRSCFHWNVLSDFDSDSRI